MAYFIKLTHSYGSKNRLQEAALKVVRSLDDHQLESPEELKRFVEDRIMRLNRSFNRCTALTVNLKKSHHQKDYLLYVTDLVTLTLYEIQGQFGSKSIESLQPAGSINCEAAGPQLNLFSIKDTALVEHHDNN
ncbi:HPF/RaiA family ribosome-associated protein [Spirosoma luteum]|uniref:HPF/RaiA family ribosome-associated protein n=1 Tax=Spirosoma luteum TaxID=431553 RepID=UPI0003709FA4|nr:HPF/RaiA family ribosome-associated protein [Spirosoma luteum]